MSVAYLKLTSKKLFKSSNKLEERTGANTKIVNNIGKTLKNQSVFKRQTIAKKFNIYQKRKDGIRRREQKDLFQASKITAPVRNIGRVITNSTKGFLGRILDAISITLVGWAVINLPVIISLSRQTGERIGKMTGVLSSFMTNTFSVLQEIGTLSATFARSISSFDFSEMGRQVDNSLSRVGNAFNRMELDFAKSLQILSEPFDFKIEEETPLPPSPSQIPSSPSTSPPAQPPTSSGSRDRSVLGTKEQRSALDAISFAEGTAGKNGYSTWADYQIHGPRDLTGLTIRQIHDLQTTFITSGKSKKTGSAVVGRYQFLTPYNQAKSAGLNPETDKFSPENQDRMAIHIMNQVGVTDAVLKSEGISSRVSAMLGSQWAPFPGSPFGQKTKSLKSIQDIYQKSLKEQNANVVQTAPLQPSPVQPGTLGSRPLQKGDVLTQSIGRGVSLITISDVFGSRGGRHGGIDITAPTGTWIALRVDCEWIGYKADFPGGPGTGYGHVLDVWAPELGVQLRFAHLMSKPNAFTKLKAGTSFAQVGSTGKSSGPHIHFEYTKIKDSTLYGSDGDPSPYVPYILLTNKPNNVAFSVPGKGTATPARVSRNNSRVSISDGITPEKANKTLVVAAPPQMYQTPAMMVGSSSETPVIVVGNSLNSLVKQRLLLELAYT